MTNTQIVKPSVGAVVFRGDTILLIKRGRAPLKNKWSIPGGKIDFGESLTDALHREVREETGVEIDNLRLLDVFEALPQCDVQGVSGHYVMIDYIADWLSGEPVAGDDAVEAEFVEIETALNRLSWDLTRQALRRALDIRTCGRNSP